MNLKSAAIGNSELLSWVLTLEDLNQYNAYLDREVFIEPFWRVTT